MLSLLCMIPVTQSMVRPKMRVPRRRSVQPFAVLIHPAPEGGYWASCPSLSGCYSQGETLDETLTNVREAIELSLAELSSREQSLLPQDASFHVIRV